MMTSSGTLATMVPRLDVGMVEFTNGELMLGGLVLACRKLVLPDAPTPAAALLPTATPTSVDDLRLPRTLDARLPAGLPYPEGLTLPNGLLVPLILLDDRERSEIPDADDADRVDVRPRPVEPPPTTPPLVVGEPKKMTSVWVGERKPAEEATDEMVAVGGN